MVNYLDQMKKKYPHVVIVANFGYSKADFTMFDWDDLLNIRNGEVEEIACEIVRICRIHFSFLELP